MFVSCSLLHRCEVHVDQDDGRVEGVLPVAGVLFFKKIK